LSGAVFCSDGSSPPESLFIDEIADPEVTADKIDGEYVIPQNLNISP
jgi:hypothetical protein